MKEVIACHKPNISTEPVLRGIRSSQEFEFPDSNLEGCYSFP